MKQLWAVTKVTLNSSFGISALRWQYLRRRQRLWEPVLIIWGMGTAVAFLSYGAYRVYLAMASVGSLFGQPELPLGLATVSSQVLVLVMGFFLVVSSFYFSRDLPILVPLPLRPGAVITAKFLTILVGEYITISFFFWPAVIAYARFTPFGLGEAVVGFIALERHFPESAENHVLAVHPGCHRQGIGRGLVNHSERWLRGRGVRALFVKTLGPSDPYPPYAGTRAFYRALGFVPLFETTTLWGEENPALVLAKFL